VTDPARAPWQGNLILAVRRFEPCTIASSVLAINSSDKFGIVVRGPRVLGPHEALAASHVLVPASLLQNMRTDEGRTRLDVAVELELGEIVG
tara:strand:+ start:519 stop:794 length:276 start_codon:yes stop_codon:yes gene_type:complete